jgi:alpha-ribazole phosphatase
VRLYLIRHPPVAVPAGICYGATDVGLLESAEACAARLRPQLPVDAPLFSSPLRRCRELAEALHVTPRFDARLSEMDFGNWEMRAWSDIPRAEIDAWAAAPLDFSPPGGESVSALRRRVEQFVGDCRAAALHDAVIVTHGGVMKVIAGMCHSLLPEYWLDLRFEFASMHVVRDLKHL